ncbi:MAG: PQQ-like beta-propeller repeat protein [Dehalococcoidia bacterium]|nr:PQQ-like beta-propeller repeat protein [Dehalococcoidia bacterium]
MRWLVVVFTLGLALFAGGIGEVAGSFTDSESSLANSFQAWTSTQWVQTTRADFEAGIASQTDTRSSTDNVVLARDSHVYALRGGSANFWVYGVPGDSWTSMTGTPNVVGMGGALAYDGVRYVYALRGNNRRTFWRYDTVSDIWATLANAPANVGAGGALAYDSSGYVYAMRGNGTNAFWRYDIANNSWGTRANTPANVADGGALAFDGAGYIYAFRGNNRTNFWRYNTVSNSWTAMANAPARVRAGGALAFDASGYIYALRGNNQIAFWQYDIGNNTWAAMANAPARVGAGGALAYAGSGYIYAFRGNGTTDFWRYDALGDSWIHVANTLANVTGGGALAFVDTTTYVNSGTVASQVRDTGAAGARWDALFWDETIPASTDIPFEVRASDTLFTADNATLTWIPVGGTSPVTSGLPSGRYMQWRATLTTLDITMTPVLEEVRVYHY